jgi:hypothetical protein
MASLTLRVSKGSPLTFAEVDGNFSALNNELAEKAPLASPALTGDPTAPTPATSDNDTSIATTAFVKAQAYAPLASPALTGTPTAPTAATATNTTQLATTAFVKAQAYAPLASPALTGTPTAPTAATSTNTTQLATTAFVKAQPFAPLASPAFTGNPTAPTPATGDSDTSIATTAFVQAAVVQSGPLAGFRNAIINGNFDVWQRGASIAGLGAGTTHYDYTADRWWVFGERSGGSNRSLTVSRQDFALGQTAVPGEPEHFLRYQEVSAGSGYVNKSLGQIIEDVRTFAGQQVTISFWAKAAASLTLPEVGLRQYFGADGSPSADVFTTLGTSLVIGTSWTKHTFTATVPSISGKTLGTNGGDGFSLFWDFPNTGTFTFDIAQVQLEPGPVATPFERRPIGTELALCQRYYHTTYVEYATASGNINTQSDRVTFTNYYYRRVDSSGSFRERVLFFQRMRQAPTVTIYSPLDGAAGQMVKFTGGTGNVTPTLEQQSVDGFTFGHPANDGGLHYQASAEL